MVTQLNPAGDFQTSSFPSVGRNRLINGEMRFDQMNGGNVFSINNSIYSCDQFFANGSGGASVTTQRLSATPPLGFTNYLRHTVTVSSTPTGSQGFKQRNGPEGTMTRDFLWGSASAKTVTLSFWVRASITGTYSVSLENSARNRTYLATYTIVSANTWEFKTLLIPGDTTGTWPTDTNSFGVRIQWDLGNGPTLQTSTVNAWQAGEFYAATGAVQLIANSGATFDLTGVQFEIGVGATPFEYRPYGLELLLCQRYYEKTFDVDQTPGVVTDSGSLYIPMAAASTTGCQYGSFQYKVQKKSSPTITAWSVGGVSGTWTVRDNGTLIGTGSLQVDQISPTNARCRVISLSGGTLTVSASSNWYIAFGHWTADAGF